MFEEIVFASRLFDIVFAIALVGGAIFGGFFKNREMAKVGWISALFFSGVFVIFHLFVFSIAKGDLLIIFGFLGSLAISSLWPDKWFES